MKKIVISCLTLFITMFCDAAIKHHISFPFFTHSYHSIEIEKVKSEIVTQLTPALGLTKDQVSKVAQTITTFLQAKAQILPLLQTNKSSYDLKFNAINSTLKNKLNGILLQSQMNTFLSLKPATNNPAQVLSHLFY